MDDTRKVWTLCGINIIMKDSGKAEEDICHTINVQQTGGCFMIIKQYIKEFEKLGFGMWIFCSNGVSIE